MAHSSVMPKPPDDDRTTSDIVFHNRQFTKHRIVNPQTAPVHCSRPIPMLSPADGEDQPRPRRRLTRGQVLICAGILLFSIGMTLWFQVVVPWWTGVQDQWNYGPAHITTLDADVQHGGISHFIASR